MKMRTKNDIRTKIRSLYGLAYVLREDIDELRAKSNDSELDRIYESVRETTETLEKIIDILAEIEYAIYLELSKGPC